MQSNMKQRHRKQNIMDELLQFDSAIGNALGWLEEAHSFLSEQQRETQGEWKGINEALAKLEPALALLKEVRTPLAGEIESAEKEWDRQADMADAHFNR
jgi:predicted nuclease with TOPRIM domain